MWTDLFGGDFPRGSADGKIANTGIVIGTLTGALRLVQAMRAVQLSFGSTKLNDQGVVNFFVHSIAAQRWQPPRISLMPHANSIVRHMGLEFYDPNTSEVITPDDLRVSIDQEVARDDQRLKL